MSTQPTHLLTPEAAEAVIAAQVELYRQMALRFNRTLTLTRPAGDTFDVVNLLDTRPVTEEEAEAATAEDAANFERILRARHRQGLEDAYLLLGCDLILSLPLPR